MTAIEQQAAAGDRRRSMAVLVDRANRFVRFIAQPSLVQLFAFCPGRALLAIRYSQVGRVPAAQRHCSDLFTDEFKLLLPGGPYPFPVPTAMAFSVGCGEIAFPVLLVLGFGPGSRRSAFLFMTLVVELTVPGWMAHPHHLGGDGSCDHGV